MFTGLVWGTGRFIDRSPVGADARLWLDTCAVLSRREPSLGDSVAVNGVCLTVVARHGCTLAFDVSAETLALTSLGALEQGAWVNLEPALTLADALGGHLVSGHVDGLGRVFAIHAGSASQVWEFALPHALSRLVAVKGSIAVDGVSLTVNAVSAPSVAASEHRFAVTLIPHTLAKTAFGRTRVGQTVNLEVDVMARYAARWSETAGKL